MTVPKSSPKRATNGRRRTQPEKAAKREREIVPGGSDAGRLERHLIVGIGASAGGLQAFKTFFANMPIDSGMAFVLVQHLDPQHRSMLVELLSSATAMPVVEAADNLRVAADHVYVIPPNATLRIAEGKLRVSKPAPAREHRRGRSTHSFCRLPRIRMKTPFASSFPAAAAMARRGCGRSRNAVD